LYHYWQKAGLPLMSKKQPLFQILVQYADVLAGTLAFWVKIRYKLSISEYLAGQVGMARSG